MAMRAWLIAASLLALAGCGPGPAGSEATTDTAAVPDIRVDPAELRPCPVLRNDLATAQDCQRAESARATIEEGLAALRAPDRMEIDKPSVIRLAIGEKPEAPPPQAAETPAPPDASATADAAAAEKPSTEAPPDKLEAPPPRPTLSAAAPSATDVAGQVPGETVVYNPLIGQFMRAQLRHDGAFKIISAPPELQEVVEGGVTIWDWTVAPTRGGDHILTVVTEAGFRDGAGRFRALQGVRPHTQTIHVYTPWWRQVGDMVNGAPTFVKAITAVIAALTALLTALLAFRAAWRKLRSGRDEAPEGGAP